VIEALTAHAYREERQEMLDAGCDDFLAKPFAEADLLDLLERHLDLEMDRESSGAEPATEPAAFRPGEVDVPSYDPEFVSSLQKALVSSDMQRIDALVESLGPGSRQDALRFFTGRFEYATLARLLGNSGG
jgi:DNA-binding response OmpR family regulator